MSQRNPMNERYTGEGSSGKTRKSAASAKPVSRAASSVRVQSGTDSNPKPKGLFSRALDSADKDAGKKASQKARKQNAREDRYNYFDPDTPEYKKWRRIWWLCIVGAIVLTGLSMFLLNGVGSRAGVATLVGGYALLAISIILDVTKVRKIRNQHYAQQREDRSKEATKSRKQQKAERKQAEAQMVAEAEAKQAEKQAKRSSRLGFLSKKADEGAAAEADAAGEA